MVKQVTEQFTDHNLKKGIQAFENNHTVQCITGRVAPKEIMDQNRLKECYGQKYTEN